MASRPAENDGQVLQRLGIDAAKWAAEFVHRRRTRDMDEGAMISWFANAIEAGRAEGRQALCPHDDPVWVSPNLALCGKCGKDVTREPAS